MTLDDLAASLPNGFHDAKLKAVSIDYVNRRASLDLHIWIGDLDAAADSEREKYRPAQVKLSGLIFWVSEPPCAGYPYDIGRELRIDVGTIQTPSTPRPCRYHPLPRIASSIGYSSPIGMRLSIWRLAMLN
jgi:hypothetical protein